MQNVDATPRVDLLIFQATAFCNIDCSYCYLPNRIAKDRISPSVVLKAVQRVLEAGWVRDRISVVWHAGEPLTVGPEYLERLLDACAPLQQAAHVQHRVQTNAMLINARFCQIFKAKDVRIGVSIDGPRDLHDACRVNRAGRGTFDAVMRGVGTLREFGIGFDVICVLTERSLGRAEELYEFFSSLGASTVGFNVDEIEGINYASSMNGDSFFERLSEFWDTMLRIHFERRAFRLREADTLLDTIRYSKPGKTTYQLVNPFAILTVAVNGSVGTFSPELLGQRDPRYGDFSIGNIASDSMTDITTSQRFLEMKMEIDSGVRSCAQQCSYFELCGGGAPSNKIAEHGTFDATETKHCKATKKVIVDSLIKEVKLHRSVKAVTINGSKTWTVPNVLDADTCRHYISVANVGPWQFGTSTRTNQRVDAAPSTRGVKRVIVDVHSILSCIRPLIPENVNGMHLVGLSEEQMMCLRYLPGDSFPAHTDSPYVPGSRSQSLFTLMVYLNDGYEGGETYFPDTKILIRPQTGMALIFAHGVRHEGREIVSGVKYALHTFVLYSQDKAATTLQGIRAGPEAGRAV